MPGFKIKGLPTRNEKRKKPSINRPFNRNKEQPADINLALLLRKTFLSVPLFRPLLPPNLKAHTECPRSCLKTTSPATRLSTRCTRLIIIITIINITLIHIITATHDPYPHLSARRITRGISPKFYPIRPRSI